VERLVQAAPPSPLPEPIRRELFQRMQSEAHRFGMEHLPIMPEW
jgi:hypothetical protein